MMATLVRAESLDVPIALIDDPLLPSRSAMDDQKLDELTESIRAIGLQQPLVLARVGERYEVIAGHRRLIACRRAGLDPVPSRVYPSKDIPHYAIQAAENAKREDLNAADEAIWFMELLEHECGNDIDKLCALVGEKLSYVNGRIELLRGAANVFEALQRGDITIGVARELNTCKVEFYRNYFLDCAIKSGAKVSTVAGWILDWLKNQAPAASPTSSEPAAAPGIAVEVSSPFTCEICGRSDHPHLIRQINIHQHCKMAIFDPLLANARGES